MGRFVCFIFFIFITTSLCLDDDERIILSAIASAFDEKNPITSAPLDEEAESGYAPEVAISAGRVIGASFPEAHGFYSIPYAEPPVGNMRFERSKILESFPNEDFNASVITSVSCYQTQTDECANGLCLNNLSEDCLVLNIHVPKTVDLSSSATQPSDRLPVMVWIHGGGLQTGSATSPLYDGRYLSNITNTIVVGINYRLGALGFLVDRRGDDVICNQGLHDQQLALQWVHNHIENFGGDKTKVTIFGNSAGAQSVMFHLMSSISAPYFQHAIVQSQPAVFQYPTITEALLTTQKVIDMTMCTDGGVDCMRNLEAETLASLSNRVRVQNIVKGDLFGAIEPFGFVLDGEEFKQNPIEFIQRGNWMEGAKVAIMGTNIEEMNNVEVFIPDFINLTKQRFENLLKFAFGDEVGTKVAAKYDEISEDKDYVALLGEVITDGFFVCPTRTIARLASDHINVYLYSFAHAMDDPSCENAWVPGGSCGYVYHSSENSFVFRSSPLIPYEFSVNDAIASNQFSYYWGNIAHTGNPSSGDVTSVEEFPEWPEYSSIGSAKTVLSLHGNNGEERNMEPWVNYVIDAPEGKLDQLYKEDICDFWDSTKFYVDLTNDHTTSASHDLTTTNIDSSSTTTTKGLLEETTSGAVNHSASTVLFVCIFIAKFLVFFR